MCYDEKDAYFHFSRIFWKMENHPYWEIIFVEGEDIYIWEGWKNSRNLFKLNIIMHNISRIYFEYKIDKLV